MSSPEDKQKTTYPFAGAGGGQPAPVERQEVRSEGRIPIAKDAEAEQPGTYVGPYRLEKKLAKGGMGQVYLAMDDALRRPVALKLMDPTLLSDVDAMKRFEREARAAASVQHENIARVYLVGLSEEGRPFLAMEFVDGGSLMDQIRRRTPMTFSVIAHLMEQVVSALAAAKKLNIVHRDIKPANIMLTQSGVAKVVDFGLAKIFFEDSYLTQEGMVLGTPSYMAPEQGQGRVVDHRADIYSVGATFYHLIVGRPPFTADSPVQIMMKHVTAPLVPMRSLRPDVPMEFDEIVGRCMRKDVDERYQDYDSLLSDIQRVRLMCQTREQGSVVGPGAETSPQGGGGKTSISLPPPPRRDGSAAQTGAPQHVPPGASSASSGKVTILSEGQGGHQGWGMGNIAAVGAACLVALVAIGFGLQQAFAPAPEMEQPTDPTAIAIRRLIERAQTNGSDEMTDREAFSLTRNTLRTLQGGVERYRSLHANAPDDLRMIANEENVVVNFLTNEDGWPLDAWGTPLGYSRAGSEIYSCGLDRSPNTEDDIRISFEGAFTVPDLYTRLTNPPRN